MSRGFPERINSMSKEEIELSIKRVKDSKSKYNKKYYKEHKELKHQYYLNHIDKWRKNMRKNKEEDKEYYKKWYAEHKEEVQAKRKERKTLEERSAYHLKWQRLNRNKFNEYQREWRKKAKAAAIDKKKAV